MTDPQAAAPPRPKTIGILGGATTQATGQYYKFLDRAVNRRDGGWDLADTLIAGFNCGDVADYARAGDWDGLAGYVDGKVATLSAGGADVVICIPDTLHAPLAAVVANHDIAMIHVADPTGAAIRAAGLSRVALFGPRTTAEMAHLRDRYRAQFGLDVILPTPEESTEIDRIIRAEPEGGALSTRLRRRCCEILHRMIQEEGIEGLILGSPEMLQLLGADTAPDLPLFNSTELHCDAAVAVAVQG